MAESLNNGAELKTDINVANSAISGAVASAGALAGTMVEGKTASDLASVGTFKSDEDYVSSQVKKAEEMAFSDMTRQDLHNKDGWTQSVFDQVADKAKDKDAFYKQVEKAGGGTIDDKGVFTAAKGNEFSNAMATLQATNMGRDKQFTVNGESFNVDTDIDGNSRVTNTSAQATSRGDSVSTKTGASVDTNQSSKVLANGYNHLHSDDKVSIGDDGKLQGNDSAKASFSEYLKNAQYTEAQIKGIIGEGGASVLDTTPEQYQELVKDGLLMGVGSAAAYKLEHKPVKNALAGKNTKSNKKTVNNGDRKNNESPIPEKHNPTPEEIKSQSSQNLKEGQASYNDYNEERQNLQGDAKKESAKRQDFEKKRADLVENGKSTASIDNEIEQSKSRSTTIDDDMHTKESQLKAQKSLSAKEMDKVVKADADIASSNKAKTRIK